MATDELVAHFTACSNSELWEVVHGAPEDYKPEARQLAEKELQRRALPDSEIAAIREEAESRRQEVDAKACRPLPWLLRLFFVIFTVGLVTIVLPLWFESSGRTRWARESWRFIGIGFLCWFGLGALIAVLTALGY